MKIVRSTDTGRTWDFNSQGWHFAESDGAFSDITFLTFGREIVDLLKTVRRLEFSILLIPDAVSGRGFKRPSGGQFFVGK